MRERSERAAKAGRRRLLDEVCEVTGYHRKAAILLRRPARRRVRRRGRPVRYGPTVIGPLRQIWEAAGYPQVREIAARLKRQWADAAAQRRAVSRRLRGPGIAKLTPQPGERG